MYANLNGDKVSPEKGLRAECPFCEEEVLAKCGDFKTWHFSHLAGSQCSFGDGKGEWHWSWQSLFHKNDVEVRITKGSKFKIADVILKDGKVLEFQNTGIDLDTVKEREKFYGKDKLVWIFNATETYDRFNLILSKNKKRILAQWKRMPEIIKHCEARVMINFSDWFLYDIRTEKVFEYYSDTGLEDITDRVIEDGKLYAYDGEVVKTLFSSFKGHTVSYTCVPNRPKWLRNAPIPKEKEKKTRESTPVCVEKATLVKNRYSKYNQQILK